MSKPVPLRYETTYHLYNRGNNGETIFRQDENCRYFLKQYLKHFHPIAETFAYCLLPNHFHFVVRIRAQAEIEKRWQEAQIQTPGVLKTPGVSKPRKPPTPSQAFGNLGNGYAKAINKSKSLPEAAERPFSKCQNFSGKWPKMPRSPRHDRY